MLLIYALSTLKAVAGSPCDISFSSVASLLFHHLPETLRAEHRRKMPFPFSRKIPPPRHQRSKEHFSLVLPSEARQWRNDSFHVGILLEKSSDFVQEIQFVAKRKTAESPATACGTSGNRTALRCLPLRQTASRCSTYFYS